MSKASEILKKIRESSNSQVAPVVTTKPPSPKLNLNIPVPKIPDETVPKVPHQPVLTPKVTQGETTQPQFVTKQVKFR